MTAPKDTSAARRVAHWLNLEVIDVIEAVSDRIAILEDAAGRTESADVRRRYLEEASKIAAALGRVAR